MAIEVGDIYYKYCPLEDNLIVFHVITQDHGKWIDVHPEGQFEEHLSDALHPLSVYEKLPEWEEL